MVKENRPRNILVIDNYDSFTFNLVQYLGELATIPLVYRNDQISYPEAASLDLEGVVISPGPGTPQIPRYFGISLDILKKLSPSIPTLGVCLGHQGIGVAYGAAIMQADELFHGKATPIYHHGKGIFHGIPDGFMGARYHSLLLDPATIPQALEVTARTENGEIMGIKHREYPIYGVQFHPESILTEHGKKILKNFLNFTGGWT